MSGRVCSKQKMQCVLEGAQRHRCLQRMHLALWQVSDAARRCCDSFDAHALAWLALWMFLPLLQKRTAAACNFEVDIKLDVWVTVDAERLSRLFLGGAGARTMQAF